MGVKEDLQAFLTEFSNDPIAVDYVLLPNAYRLLPYQREIIRTIDDPRMMFGFLEAARGMSKSYLVARWCCQACAKIPNYKIVFSGPSFRQSQTPFRYVIDLIEENPPLKMLLAKQPTMGNVRWEVMFKNRSRIVALPASAEKLHGERANVIVFEEFFAYPEELHNRTVKPMLAVQSNRSVANKALYVTSADFQFRWAYQRRAAIAAQARAKDPRYAFMSYKITDMPSPERGGFYSLDQLEDDRMNMPPEIYKQQYYNVWLTDAGTFYVLSVLMNKDLRRTEAVLKGDATKQYVMGIDVARSLRSAGDDSAIAIWEVGESDSLVNIQAYNNITIETLGNEVMRFMDMFPTTNRIVLDYGGGGVHLRDELYKKGIVEIEEFNPAVPGRRILQRFPNTPEEITHAHYQFRGGFETRKLSVPDVPDDGDEAKELVCKAVDDTLKQMANIEATPLASGFFKFDVPNGQKKDLAYAAMYGHWGCQLLKERKRQEDAAAKISDISDLLDPMAELGFF